MATFRISSTYKFCPERMYLDEESVLVFSKDFRIICEMYGIYPKEYLQHFMSKVSWAEAHAIVDLNADTMDSGLLFFVKLSDGLGNLSRQNLKTTDAVLEYFDEAQQLKAKHYIVRNLEERIAIYREFFQKHYNKIVNAKS